MKLNRFKFKQILKLHLLNSRVYESIPKKTNFGLLTDFKLTRTIRDFKKVLHVVFEYHKLNKRILFVGMPTKLKLQINKLTQHVAVDADFEFQTVVSSNLKAIDLSKDGKSYSKSLMPKLSKKVDLIFFIMHEKNQNINVESKVAKIPVITFDLEEILIKGFYNLKGFSKVFSSKKNLLLLGFNFLFNKLKQS